MTNKHFDLIAGCYERTARFNASEALLDALGLPGEGILLDAGGGTGRAAAVLSSYTTFTMVADISMGMMQHAMNKNLACLDSPAESLPFTSSSIDRVFMMDAFHHVKNQGDTAKELFRVLKNGGHLLIIEPNIRKFSVRLIALIEKILLMNSRFLTGEQISDHFMNLDATVQTTYIDQYVWVTVRK